jgi:anti-anti-sigma regulatory factor
MADPAAAAADDDWGDASALAEASAAAIARTVAETLSEEAPEAAAGAVMLAADPDARELKEALVAALAAGAPAVDASPVERLSPAAFQVLLAAMRDASAAGARLTVRNPSFAFSLTFEAFGLGGDDEPFTVEYC